MTNKNSWLRANWPRLLLVALAAALIIAFFALDLRQYLTLDYIKQAREGFQSYYEAHALLVLGAYFVIYVLMAALSLPGAAVFSLAGAALFGFWRGLVVVSFASSIGATLAFVLARYLLRDWVQARFGHKLQGINAGVECEGAFYLFTLRLVPVFPFFLINLAMALTPLKALTFYWVSQLGMLPGTIVFINAGKELGQIQSLGDILSLNLLLSFALLGIFPLAVKKGLAWYRKTGR